MYEKEPRYNEPIFPVPWHFVTSEFHCAWRGIQFPYKAKSMVIGCYLCAVNQSESERTLPCPWFFGPLLHLAKQSRPSFDRSAFLLANTKDERHGILIPLTLHARGLWGRERPR